MASLCQPCQDLGPEQLALSPPSCSHRPRGPRPARGQTPSVRPERGSHHGALPSSVFPLLAHGASAPRRWHTLQEPHPCPSDTPLPCTEHRPLGCPVGRTLAHAALATDSLRPSQQRVTSNSGPPQFQPCLPRAPGPIQVRATQSRSRPGRPQASVHAPVSPPPSALSLPDVGTSAGCVQPFATGSGPLNFNLRGPPRRQLFAEWMPSRAGENRHHGSGRSKLPGCSTWDGDPRHRSPALLSGGWAVGPGVGGPGPGPPACGWAPCFVSEPLSSPGTKTVTCRRITGDRSRG